MPKVSVITLTYNHEKYIGKCIDSVLAQSFHDWEIIMVDDGSTDSTANIAAAYSKINQNIKFIGNSHVGPQHMRKLYNEALRYTSGSLIAILDGDDYWPKRKLEVQVPAFDVEDVVLAWGKVIRVDENSRQLSARPPKPQQYLNMSRVETVRRLLLGCYIPSISVICRKDALLKINDFQQPAGMHCVDYPTWLALANVGCFRFIDEVLGYWVQHPDSLSSRFAASTEWWNCSIDALKAMPEKLRREIGFSELELREQLKSDLVRAGTPRNPLKLLLRRMRRRL